MPLRDDLKEKFRGLLLTRKSILTGDVNGLHSEAISTDGDVRMPTHMADMAIDTTAIEDNMSQIVTMGDELREIDSALLRIEDGSYGVCTACERRIGNERLEALPYAGLCIECKQAEESGQGAP